MRCQALISDDQQMERRASEDRDLRCQRQARKRLARLCLCYQHYGKLKREHDQILARILAIPVRES